MKKFISVTNNIGGILALVAWCYYTIKGVEITSIWWLGALILSRINSIEDKINKNN